MSNDDLMLEFKTLLDKHTPEEGGGETAVKDFYIARQTKAYKKKPEFYQASVFFLASGQKNCYLDNQKYPYGAGNYLMVFLPMSLEVEAFDVSKENPLLVAGLALDLNLIADMLLKLDRADKTFPPVKSGASAGILTAPIKAELLEPVVRLLRSLDDPVDAAILGESHIKEIYYRILRDEQASSLKKHLQQNGQIQQISRSVSFINQHIDQPVKVEQLAELAHMSPSHFHKSFRDVMKVSPLQYAKSMKLFHAQTLLIEGKKVNQAAYAVGYNSTTQFSREYKRQFGFAPSETR